MEEERYIAIELKINCSLDQTLREVLGGNGIWFDPDQTHLFGASLTDFGRILQLAIYNPLFGIVPEGKCIPVYGIETAKKEYPFLFRKV